MLLRPRTGLLTPRTGGRPQGARIRPSPAGQPLHILQATAPLPAGVWYADALELLLEQDLQAEERAARLNRAAREWRFEPARERWTFASPCLDPLTGQMVQFHDPASPPPPHHSPELYEGARGARLRETAQRAPAAWCRQCRRWIDQDNGEEF